MSVPTFLATWTQFAMALFELVRCVGFKKISAATSARDRILMRQSVWDNGKRPNACRIAKLILLATSSQHYKIEPSTANLETSISDLRSATVTFPRSRSAMFWGQLNSKLGDRLFDLAKRQLDGTSTLNDARTAYEQALLSCTPHFDPRQWAALNLKIADTLIEQMRWSSAIETCLKVRKSIDAKRCPYPWAWSILKVAEALIKQLSEEPNHSNAQEARRLLHSMRELDRKAYKDQDWLTFKSATGTLFILLFIQYQESSDYEAALSLLGEVEPLLSTDKNITETAGVRFFTGAAQLVHGILNRHIREVDIAIENLRSADALFQRQADNNMSARASLVLSQALAAKSEVVSGSPSALAEALEILQAIMRSDEGKVLLSRSPDRTNDIDRERASVLHKYFSDELRLTDSLEEPEEKVAAVDDELSSQDSHRLGIEASQRGELEIALYYFAQSDERLTSWLDKNEGVAGPTSVGEALCSLVATWCAVAEATGELADLNCAIDLAEGALDKISADTSLIHRSDLAYKRALAIGKLVFDHRKTSDIPRVSAAFEDALNESEWSVSPQRWFAIAQDRARVLAAFVALENFENQASISSARDALQLCLERALILIGVSESQAERSKISADVTGLGDALAYLHLHEQDYEAAFETISYSRALRTNQNVAEEMVSNEWSGKLRSARLEWQKAARQLEKQQFDLIQAGPQQTHHEPKGRLSGEKVSSLFATYIEIFADAHADKIDLPSLEDATTALPEDTVLVLMVVAAYGSALLVIPKRTHRLNEDHVIWLKDMPRSKFEVFLSGPEGWLQTYDYLRNLVSAEADGTEIELGVEKCALKIEEFCTGLGAAIVGPIWFCLEAIGQEQKVTEVAIVPPGYISALPLHAAVVPTYHGNSDGRRFIQDYALSVWPSVRALAVRMRKGERSADRNHTLLAANTLKDELTDPTWHEGLFSNLPGVIPNVLSGPSGGQFLDALQNADCLYLRCHGSWNDRDARKSGLQLSDGVLTFENIADVGLKRRGVAFLGACEAGMIGVERNPDEFVGLATGFFEAGLSCVIAGLWLVERERVTHLASSFFEHHLVHGMRPAVAMQKALLTVFESAFDGSEDERLEELFFWAPFVVTGG